MLEFTNIFKIIWNLIIIYRSISYNRDICLSIAENLVEEYKRLNEWYILKAHVSSKILWKLISPSNSVPCSNIFKNNFLLRFMKEETIIKFKASTLRIRMVKYNMLDAYNLNIPGVKFIDRV